MGWTWKITILFQDLLLGFKSQKLTLIWDQGVSCLDSPQLNTHTGSGGNCIASLWLFCYLSKQWALVTEQGQVPWVQTPFPMRLPTPGSIRLSL